MPGARKCTANARRIIELALLEDTSSLNTSKLEITNIPDANDVRVYMERMLAKQLGARAFKLYPDMAFVERNYRKSIDRQQNASSAKGSAEARELLICLEDSKNLMGSSSGAKKFKDSKAVAALLDMKEFISSLNTENMSGKKEIATTCDIPFSFAHISSEYGTGTYIIITMTKAWIESMSILKSY